MIKIITFHDLGYAKSFNLKDAELHKLSKEAPADHYAFDYEDLHNLGFLHKHRNVMYKYLTNNGCIWKPYLIRLVMENSDIGDTIIYTDVGDELLPGCVSWVENHINNKFLFLETPHSHRLYTKKYCFKAMNCLSDPFLFSKQLDAGFIGISVNSDTFSFIKEWETWCYNYDVLFDDTIEDEWPDLIRHSRDQSILTNLRIMHGYDIIPVESIINKYIKFNVRSG